MKSVHMFSETIHCVFLKPNDIYDSMGVGDGISSHLLPFKYLKSVRKKQPASVGLIWPSDCV